MFVRKLVTLLQAISPLGWRVAASADVASKNLDSNERQQFWREK
jgi:hypothetical protein